MWLSMQSTIIFCLYSFGNSFVPLGVLVVWGIYFLMLCLHAMFSVIFRMWVLSVYCLNVQELWLLLLPVREPLWLVSLVINLIFMIFGFLQGVSALPKFEFLWLLWPVLLVWVRFRGGMTGGNWPHLLGRNANLKFKENLDQLFVMPVGYFA